MTTGRINQVSFFFVRAFVSSPTATAKTERWSGGGAGRYAADAAFLSAASLACVRRKKRVFYDTILSGSDGGGGGGGPPGFDR